MTRIKLSNFTNADILYLKEYAQVMGPVATALDLLQGENQAYLGCLLPTLGVAMKKLEKNLSGSVPLTFCKPLVLALLQGIKKRFDPLLNDLECQLAAAFHPRFRLMWLQNREPDRVNAVKEAMVSQVEACLKEEDEVAAASSSDTSVEENPEDDWYGTFTQAPVERGSRNVYKSKAETLVGTWLAGLSRVDLGDGAFMGEKVLSKLFIKFNTPVPSSAAVERFFSQGKDILKPKRASLADDTFEMLMFLRGNKHHLRNLVDG
jgi:hypothetical protein